MIDNGAGPSGPARNLGDTMEKHAKRVRPLSAEVRPKPARLGTAARTFIERAPSSPEQDAAARDAIALRLAYRRAVTSLGVVMEGYRLAMILGGQSPAAFDASPEVVEARAILAIAEANR